MKILKPGKVEQRKFTCPKCGCVFVAENGTDRIWWKYKKNCGKMPMVRCLCGEMIEWYTGDFYEEPVEDKKSDRERFFEILLTTKPMVTVSDFVDYLIANGVTFREG